MADCSATGTAMDRAARVMMGNPDAAKHVGALLGHAGAIGSQTAGTMPLAAPDQLAMPPASMANVASAPQAQSSMQGFHQHHGQHHSTQPDMFRHHHMMPPNMMHQQHAMAQAMFQQHQQQLMQQQMMQQQMQMAASQQQQHMQQQHMAMEAMKQQQHATSTQNAQANLKEATLENWHEGLEQEMSNFKFPEEEEVLGHPGMATGASIESLAAAWAQAEAEYEDEAQHTEDHANWFQGSQDNFAPRPYDFINKVEDQTTDMPNVNWMEQGYKHFKEGNIKEAVRAFEMELQQNNPDNATAWRMLGRCHAENDMDPDAIKCLEAAVDRDPYSAEALLALGVSYVNELNHEKALENMKAWLTHNPNYAGMDLTVPPTEGPRDVQAFEEVKQLLHKALQMDPTDAGDIHEALGVIYNVKKDYDEAAQSFRKALATRPDDYQLWNKLGATLANGSQSDQALPAYQRALQLKPKYARAWLNLAISHSNLQDHDEAARCYLQCLALNPGATHCWTYLRMALSCAEKWDILPLVFSQDLAAFQQHYDFVMDG
eukprot:Nitzschia sp. Nitz4//scaffold35_size145790//60193//61827//NITZ4_003023-RA/size145790-processed-gene-0.234-mRNA-1//-1//CDS//3329549103//6715//frame0